MSRAPRYEAYVGPRIARVLSAGEWAWRALGVALVLIGILLVGAYVVADRPFGWLAAGLGALVAGLVELSFAARRKPAERRV